MGKNHKRVVMDVTYIECLFILASMVTGYNSILAFASLTCIYVGITNSAVRLKNCAITAKI